MNIYITSLILSFGINIFFFVFANLFKTDKFTDFTYGLTFIVLTLFFLFKNETFYSHQIILSVMVVAWGARLIGYLLTRILKIGKDSRFDERRNDTLEFLKFWILQAITVWVVMLPSVFLLNQNQPKSLNSVMILGIFVWAVALTIEAIADQQKFNFKNNPKNKGLWIDSGLWKYSRHPNYFGEMLVWWGIFLFITPFLAGIEWLLVIGPIFITFMLSFVSGIPILEKRYDEKYKDNKEYQEYRQKTSILVPFPPKS